MLLVLCFIVIFVSTFYAHKHLYKIIHKFSSKDKKTTATSNKMSDDEFCDPSGAKSRWHKTNEKKSKNTVQASIFRWKRKAPSDAPDISIQQNDKRQKIDIFDTKDEETEDIVEVTDDESVCSISDESNKQESPVKNKLSDDIISLTKRKFDVEAGSPSKLNLEPTSTKKFYPENSSEDRSFISKYSDVPLPPGMPPVIAGVPVKFPITPYKSQISVMNAVIRGCKNKEHCLLESPTGSGKTLALLCAALAWQANFQESHLARACKTFKNEDNPEDDYEDLESKMESMMNENLRPKIYYGSRTHKQIEQVLREFRKTAYANVPMTILSSREHTCIQDVKGVSKTKLCNDLLDPAKKRRCKFYGEESKRRNFSHAILSGEGCGTPWDIEDLVELGRKIGSCPYFAARDMMEQADIIFTPYNYLIDPVIRSSMKINLKGDIIIIDEAHNIEDICRDVGSANFREDFLGEVIEDCKLVFCMTKISAYEILENYLLRLATLIQEQHIPETGNIKDDAVGVCWTGEELWTLFKMNHLGNEAFSQFQSASKLAIQRYNEVKEDIQMKGKDDPRNPEDKKSKSESTAITFVTKKLIEELTAALEGIMSPVTKNDYRCTITKSLYFDARDKVSENTWTTVNGSRRLRALKFMCMNSAVTFVPIAQQARSVILASGTLSPTSTFESELGMKFAHKLHANHVVPKEQVYVRGIPCGPSGTTLRATYQNVQTLPFKDDLGRLVLQVCQSVPHGVLCFFSSYSMMASQIERWQETDVWNELEKCKHILKETRTSTELDEIMREYREAIQDTEDGPSHGITGALLFAVFRGKVAEGIDFSDNEARCVLTIGIPFAVQYDPAVKYKREYNDMNRSRGLLSGSEWYTVQAYRALNQALGRCIRHRNDWGAVLLVDERLLSPTSIAYLPKWIRDMRLEGMCRNLKSELTTFVQRQKIRDKGKSPSSDV